MTGESLGYTLTKEVSEEINADRAPTSQIMTAAEAGGTINAELSYAEYDPFIAGVLQGTWAPYGTDGAGTTFEATVTATTITADAAPVGTSAFTNLVAGQWFTLSVPPTSPNYGRAFQVHPVTAPTSTVITLAPATPAVPEVAPVPGVAVRNARVSNGVTMPSFTIEREVGDASEFFAYRGMVPSSMSLSMSSGSRTTIDFDFMGRDTVQQSTTTLTGAPVPSRSFDIMSGVSGTTCALLVDGAPLAGTFINSISLSYDNSLRAQTALCALGAVGIGAGTINLTADVELYFASGAAFYDSFLSNKNVALTFTTFDMSGNGYVWHIPKANISTYTVNAGSRDSDLMVSVSVTGLLDNGNPVAALRKVLIVDRVGAAVTP